MHVPLPALILPRQPLHTHVPGLYLVGDPEGARSKAAGQVWGARSLAAGSPMGAPGEADTAGLLRETDCPQHRTPCSTACVNPALAAGSYSLLALSAEDIWPVHSPMAVLGLKTLTKISEYKN